MARKDYEKKYTKPKLREKIKEELKNSSKGGKKGQWSARKSQLLVQEYEKRGGGYKKDKNDKEAQSLKKWSDEDWQTKEGKGKARDDGKVHRYLPKKVWDELTKKEKEEVEKKKKKASKKGKQYVEWTPAVKKKMKKLGYSTGTDDEPSKKELYDKAKELDISGRSKMSKKELKEAVANHEKDKLKNKKKKELDRKAKKLGISGYNNMKKKELIKAIKKER